ncbi:MAG TPA: hypothetical protein VLS45_06170 [Methylomicrobium sp.]|nr:hypothetical protein [Methylomicrobium sp.]
MKESLGHDYLSTLRLAAILNFSYTARSELEHSEQQMQGSASQIECAMQ